MHLTSDARLALVGLLALTGVVALARAGEAKLAQVAKLAQPAPARAIPHTQARAAPALSSVVAASPEGDALRDGRGIDPNRASAAELELLPGVGPKLAEEIVRERARAGVFAGPDALRRVRGIGAKTLAKIAPFLRFASEGLEQPADAQGHVGGTERARPVEQHPAAHVEPQNPGARD